MTRTVTESEVVVGGIRSPLLQAGDPSSSTAAVMVHGNPGSSRDWRGVVGAVGEHTRALALDMPGFGRADKPRDFPHTVEGYAAHLDAALRELGVEHAHLVLHDFGGPWGLTWAATHPEQVASVTLVNTGVLRHYRWHWMARLWQTPRLGEAIMAASGGAGSPSRRTFRALLDHAYPGHPSPPRLPRDLVDAMAADFDVDTRHAVLELYRASAHLTDRAGELTAALQQIRCPALVVWGARDHYIGVEHAVRQREPFPGAEVVVLPGSGHWPMLDDPATVETLVSDFVARA